MADPIVDSDLHAFIDGQLDATRRIEVEDFLARHPDVAARLMADLRTRDMLRLAFPEAPSRSSPRQLEAARRLQRGFLWRDVGLKLQQAAAIAMLIGIGWFAHEKAGVFDIGETEASTRPPAFVVDAQHAHDTALLRTRMASQVAARSYDAAEILKETGIAVPDLPQDWRVADVQVFPSQEGHGLEMALDAPQLGRVSLFASRTAAARPLGPSLARSTASLTIYWQAGTLAYALTGSAPEPALRQAAAKLSTLN
jgi:anti-sigma factor RsiW